MDGESQSLRQRGQSPSTSPIAFDFSSTGEQISYSYEYTGFTFRSVVVGLLVGSIMCCSNMYFGLQTGWITMGSLQSAVLGFAVIKLFGKIFANGTYGFGVCENVLIQTVAVATAAMPLGSGLISVIPAFTMLTIDDNPTTGSIRLDWWQLVLWSLGLAFFGAFIAVPLRDQTIVREKLRFPSGTATAKIIRVLHNEVKQEQQEKQDEKDEEGELSSLVSQNDNSATPTTTPRFEWRQSVNKLLLWFIISFVYTIIAGQVKSIQQFPVFSWIGLYSLTAWGWTLSPSFGYIGQGMIMGPNTCFSMLAGAIFGYIIVGPFALSKGWVSKIGGVDGGTGWVMWISLAIMLGDSLTSLCVVCIQVVVKYVKNSHGNSQEEDLQEKDSTVGNIPSSWWIIGLILAAILCTVIVVPMFGLPFYEPLVSVILASLVATLSVRALGMTDLNPASGVAKLSQLIFALISPGKVVTNIVAGAIAEAGAIQSGEMMQDFKCAYLLGVHPRPQFYGMLIGSGASVFISVAVYQLYVDAYQIPSSQFPAPSAQIWIDMAHLVNGGSLPTGVVPFGIVCGIIAVFLVILSSLLTWKQQTKFARFIPSGIGFAVGMYISPKYTIPRVVGSIIEQIWLRKNPNSHSLYMVIVASGLVLGEGTASIINACLKAFLKI